jgi:hypothetical protein
MNGLARWSWVAALAIGGCTAITGTDGFEQRGEPLSCGNDPGSSLVDMTLDLTDMNAHEDNLVVADLVRVDGALMRRQVGRVIYDPLGAADLTVSLPCSVVDGDHQVDLVADLDNDRMLEPCVDDPATEGLDCIDHQWRLDAEPDGTLSYQHDLRFTSVVGPTERSLPRGLLPIRAIFTNMERFANAMMEVHVRRLEDDVARETILVYRREAIPESSALLMFEPELLAGLVIRGERFKIALWIDTNGNGLYDRPREARTDRDYATVIDGLADTDGLRIVFDGNAPPTPADVEL